MEMHCMGVSVIICCYNSAGRLPETLRHLARQRVAAATDWEVIIIDNNSSDNTGEVARQCWQQYQAPVPLVLVDEPVPGLSNARLKGFEAARYGFVLFCDDDNWLAEDYVQRAYEIMIARPDVGALGGRAEAVTETAPPAWFRAYYGIYAVGLQAPDSGPVAHLYGAGMVIRKSHWDSLRQAGYESRLSDRVGKKMTSGGDTELCLTLRLAGYTLWFDKQLKFKHFIPKQRLHWEHVQKFFLGSARTTNLIKPLVLVLDEDIATRAQVKKYLPVRDAIYFFRTSGLQFLMQYLLSSVVKKYRWSDERKLAIQYELALATRWLLHAGEWYNNLEYILELKKNLASAKQKNRPLIQALTHNEIR